MSKAKEKSGKNGSGWWRFTGDDEVFRADHPDTLSRLYFPLCNDAGLLSAITPRLHGDIKTGLNSFLTLPLSVEDLHNTRSSRNFWVRVEGKDPWSATGSSAAAEASRYKSPDKSHVDAGALWHQPTRENKPLGLRAKFLNFTPITQDPAKIMLARLPNPGRKPVRFTPTAAIP